MFDTGISDPFDPCNPALKGRRNAPHLHAYIASARAVLTTPWSQGQEAWPWTVALRQRPTSNTRFALRLRHLTLNHTREDAACLHELLWIPHLCDVAVRNHNNLVCMGDGSHTMGDDEDGLSADQL